jgi:hypothetical protein
MQARSLRDHGLFLFLRLFLKQNWPAKPVIFTGANVAKSAAFKWLGRIIL